MSFLLEHMLTMMYSFNLKSECKIIVMYLNEYDEYTRI